MAKPREVFGPSAPATAMSPADSWHREGGRVPPYRDRLAGTKEHTLEEAEKLKGCYKHIFEDILELTWRTAWVTPWFMAQEGKTGLSEMTGAGTVDYEAILPYNGNWIEFQNLSVNGEKYPKGFTVKAQSGEALWSGCSSGPGALGQSFLSQKG